MSIVLWKESGDKTPLTPAFLSPLSQREGLLTGRDDKCCEGPRRVVREPCGEKAVCGWGLQEE